MTDWPLTHWHGGCCSGQGGCWAFLGRCCLDCQLLEHGQLVRFVFILGEDLEEGRRAVGEFGQRKLWWCGQQSRGARGRSGHHVLWRHRRERSLVVQAGKFSVKEVFLWQRGEHWEVPVEVQLGESGLSRQHIKIDSACEMIRRDSTCMFLFEKHTWLGA